MSSSKRKQSVCRNNVEENKNSEVPDSVNMVMNLEELRDIIVTQVIAYESYSKGNRKHDIRSLRLVSKCWLSSVSKVLYKNGIPLIHIATAKHNAKTLDEFVKKFRSDFSANNRNAPTYSLKIASKFLTARNFSTLQNCLVYCGKGLTKLEMVLSKDNHLPKALPKFTMPTLKKLMFNPPIVITFDSSSESESETEEHQLEMDCIINAGNLLKHLLEGSSSLEELTLTLIEGVGLNALGFDKYLLPTTLSNLFISVYSVKDAEILSRIVLPKLSNLSLSIDKTPVSADLFFNMLNNWRKTLKILNLDFDLNDDTQRMHVRWPVMEKLTNLLFNGHHYELNQVNNSLETCLPNLEQLDLSLTETGFQIWCVNSVFQLVETLTISLVSPTKQNIAINLQNIQLTNMTFSNVTSINITILGNETSVLQYIFKEMVKLTELGVKVIGTRSIKSSTFWDALLTGVSAETAEELKSNLDNPDSTEIIENINTPSIRRLTNLTMLTFEHDRHEDDFEDEEPIISEVPFIHAFFKMPELVMLSLYGRFQISDEIMQKSLKPKKPKKLFIFM